MDLERLNTVSRSNDTAATTIHPTLSEPDVVSEVLTFESVELPDPTRDLAQVPTVERFDQPTVLDQELLCRRPIRQAHGYPRLHLRRRRCWWKQSDNQVSGVDCSRNSASIRPGDLPTRTESSVTKAWSRNISDHAFVTLGSR